VFERLECSQQFELQRVRDVDLVALREYVLAMGVVELEVQAQVSHPADEKSVPATEVEKLTGPIECAESQTPDEMRKGHAAADWADVDLRHRARRGLVQPVRLLGENEAA